jgi:acetyl esterase/lipase
MPSPESHQIRQWLFQNMKNAPPPSSIQAAREAIKALRKPLPVGTVVEHVIAGGVPSEWVSAPNVSLGNIFLCLHGGGYTMGTSTGLHPFASLLSAASGCRGLVIDYRLAPEHPFPAAIEDTTAVYRWILEQGNPAQNIIIIGLSCGGGLALATMIALRDAAVQLPAGAVLLSPWTDLVGTGESMTTRAEIDPMITPEMNRFHAALYANGTDLHHPLISPLYADLHGLPPMLIHVGSDEIMFDDSTRLAERAKDAGVEVTLDIGESMWHNWHAFAPQLPEGLQAIELVGQFIRRKLTR